MPAPRRPSVVANLGLEAVAASTAYVLIDLSDATNFPHTPTNYIDLLALFLNAEKAGDGVYDLWVGVVTENDNTDGSVNWLHVFHLQHVVNSTDSTDRFAQSVDFTLGGANADGLRCQIVSGSQKGFVGNQTQADNANWDANTNRVGPAGNAMPAVGDIVVWAEEVSGTGTLDFSLTAIYEAH